MDPLHIKHDRDGYTSLPIEQNLPSHQLTHPSYIPYLRHSGLNHLGLEHNPYYLYETMEGRPGHDFDVYENHVQYELTSSNPLGPSQDLSQDHYDPLQLWDNTNPEISEHPSVSKIKHHPPPIPSDQTLSHMITFSKSVPIQTQQTTLVPTSAPYVTEAQEPQSLSRRRYTLKRWTEVRPTIQDLYIDHGYSLCKTRKIMEEQHEFVASCVP